MAGEKVLILDFGSQYTQLIARRVREMGVYSVIERYDHPVSEFDPSVSAIILSGGPSSIYESDAPRCSPEILQLGKPILGICYGMQVTAHVLGCPIVKGGRSEYGETLLTIVEPDLLFDGFDKGETTRVWMSHKDRVEELPPGFRLLAHTENSHIASFGNLEKKIYGVQFHPEVIHTVRGMDVLRNFLFRICRLKGDWSLGDFIEEAMEGIRTVVANGKAIGAMSGGVDSSVASLLAHRAIGKNYIPIFVDTGLLRSGDRERVESLGREFQITPHIIDAEEDFLRRLKGVTDPEEKRRRIGNMFIEIFETEAAREGGIEYLIQGTLYPDVIESLSVRGPSSTIKTHHNVGGLPDNVPFTLIEPLKELFKDEVREVGRALGASDQILGRHPFPGPGLAVRILGEVTREALTTLRSADRIFIEEIEAMGIYDEIWQAFAVLLPVRSVGVMGDERTYENVVALRAVTSRDGMTADWYRFTGEQLGHISNRIVNEVEGVNRVVYDVSSKPPSTIEWE
ncbi:MAG: glutamine-hydrolyzing GMP synthase [Candidatus Glassbacteria bacterium]